MGDIILNLFILAIGLLVGGVGLYIVYIALRALYRWIFFDYSFDAPEDQDGEVVDMKFTPRRTTYTGKTTVSHPEKNEVFIKTEYGTMTLDSDKLYQRVRVDEKVIVEYQRRYQKPRFWNGGWKYDGTRLLSVTNIHDKTVHFNDEKPVLRRK